MAAGHPYGLESEIRNKLGLDLVNKLKAMEGNTAGDVYTRAANDASTWVDIKLSGRWSVPFEAQPASPLEVNLLWLYRACVELLATRFPDSPKTKYFQGELASLLKTLTGEGAELHLSDGTIVSRLPADQGSVGLSGDGIGGITDYVPVFGVDDDGNDGARNL